MRGVLTLTLNVRFFISSRFAIKESYDPFIPVIESCIIGSIENNVVENSDI